MSTAAELAPRLSKASVKKAWDVYSAFDWPEKLDPEAEWYMSPELISIHGTELWDELSEVERKRLSFYEIINFFSFVLYGERPLIQGLSSRLYRKSTLGPISEYLHHFIDEENKHMIMFGMFCNRYAGKIYPEKKMVMPREYAPGEEEIAFYCKVLVVEELGDFYNLKMMSDKTINPLVAKINKVHHVDEARHLSFGRELLRELAADICPKWSSEQRRSFESWLADYLGSSWGDFYNPSMYKDAGLEGAYNVRKMALAHPACAEFRARASEKLVDYFLDAGLLSQRPSH
ncbi:MAG: diiron oxygenase [bacterium]